MFTHDFAITWAQLDPNYHLRHSAYADIAAQVRLVYFTQHGFTTDRFREEGLGPILFREETLYKREVRPEDILTVSCEMDGLSADAGKFRILHHMTRQDGVLAAVLTAEGAFISYTTRRLVLPPPALQILLQQMPRTATFVELLRGTGARA